ncbi:hypothetical protein [Caproiciproducens faecalis]|uniref:Uncharacterized protein n=1 Tax=Caproiciproducens faecalis TaxID=2820301 RepID=A0ABS7DK35_9FIRM|nr:hypothetical protein [Caproiciproducens faecalis]MBW7571638.1 hypothetical protein [Caproiciproducens faecalis]
MRRAGKSWSNRQQTQNSDQLSVKTIWKFLLLAVICTAFLCYTLPRLQTGANFTASGSATATFVFNTEEESPLNAVPGTQLKGSSSAAAQASSAASSSESTAPSSAATAPESTAPSSAATAPESTVSQPETESRSEIQSSPVQEGTHENSVAASEAQNSTAETQGSTQSGAES